MSENETQEEGTVATEEAPEAPEAVQEPAQEKGRNTRKHRVGTVVSDKGDKTVIVEVARQFAHPLYGKQVARTKRYPAHDENNEYLTGDRVRIMESRRLSKTKHWRVIELIERPE